MVLRLVVYGVVLDVSDVVLFLLRVCVCDLFLFSLLSGNRIGWPTGIPPAVSTGELCVGVWVKGALCA